MISTSADDFFCTNIATIIDEHHISQSTAGCTLMAFGNGGIFVSSVVVALIIFVATRKQDFKLNKFTFLRDTLFYLVALAWLAFIVLFNKKLFIWEPSVYLCIYFAYALVVILSGRYFKRRASRKTRPAATSIAELRIENADLKANGNGHLKPPLSNGIQPQIERAPAGTSTSPLAAWGRHPAAPAEVTARRALWSEERASIDNHWALPTAHRTRHMTVLEPRRTSHGLITPKVVVDLAEETAIQSPGAQEGMFLEHGKFFEAETEEETRSPRNQSGRTDSRHFGD
ncbi:Sodium/calcium exchanger protein [Aphelenchoides fujianensis]|nr:Sodium/calcium exchanger protein [Aphelenchoides fujianensis]